jgi:hypothetical protein
VQHVGELLFGDAAQPAAEGVAGDQGDGHRGVVGADDGLAAQHGDQPAGFAAVADR